MTTGSQTIHTVPSGWDEVWLYAVNNTASNIVLVLTVTGGNEIRTNIGAGAGLTLIVPGLTFQSGQTISGYITSGSSAAVVVYGFANRITN
jgi:hypothetical protein